MADSFHEEEVLGKAYDARLMRRLLAYLRPYWVVVSLALAAIVLYGVFQAAPPYFIKLLVDRYLDPASGAKAPAIFSRILSPDPRTGIVQIALLLFLPTALVTFLLEFAQAFTMGAQYAGIHLP